MAAALFFASVTAQAATPPGGPLIAWGDNSLGQCAVPPGLTNIVRFSAGHYHGLAQQADGTIVTWGDNNYGQCSVPANMTNVADIVCGGWHNQVLTSNKTVIAWGLNNFGQSSVPPGLSNVVAIAAGAAYGMALKADGTVAVWGDNRYGQCNIPAGLANVAAIAAGYYHCIALHSNGTVTVWGYSCTDVPAGLSNVVAIAGGGDHCLALKADGTVTAWGFNTWGQCSVPPNLSNVVAVAGGGSHSLALKADGTIAVWGDNTYNQCDPPSGLTNVAAIATGWNQCLALEILSPSITGQPMSETVLAGANVSFSVTASGPAPLNYQWTFDGSPIPGATDASLTLTNAQPTEAGSYAAVVNNESGSAVSEAAMLTVLTAPVFQSATQEGEMILLTWTAIPGETYQIQFKNSCEGAWLNLGSLITATNAAAAMKDRLNSSPSERLYRAVLVR